MAKSFVRKRLSNLVHEYVKQAKTTGEYNEISRLNQELCEARQQIEHLKSLTATVTSLEPKITVTKETTNVEEPETPYCVERNDVINSLSWEELIKAAQTLADSDYNPSKIKAAAIFPFIISDSEISLTEEQINDLIYNSYLQQIEIMKADINELYRDIGTKCNDLSQKTLSINITLEVSKWFQDFLHVYERANSIKQGQYPKPRNLHNIAYLTQSLRVVNNRSITPLTRKSYAIDLGYHIPRAASLLTTIRFSPTMVNMLPAIYTDFQLLIHFAFRHKNNMDLYMEFLKEPSLFMTGTRYQTLHCAIQEAANLLLNTFQGSNLFFKNDSKGQISVQHKAGNNMSVANIPLKVMTVLNMDVIENIDLFKKQNLLSSNWQDSRALTPLGRLLNFDEKSSLEFSNLYNQVPYTSKLQFNAQLNDSVSSFKCVHKIYMMLLMACGALLCLRESPNSELPVGLLFSRCVKHDDGKQNLMFASTTEAFPGLSIYTILASHSSDDITQCDRPANVLETEHPGMSKPVFFKDRPERIAFFDVFGAYLTRVSSLTRNKANLLHQTNQQNSFECVRFIPDQELDIIRTSCHKALTETQSGYANLLLHTKPTKRDTQNIRDYFMNKGCLPKYTKSLSKYLQYDNIRQFYSLPILYSARCDVVDESKVPSKQFAGSSNVVQVLLDQIASNTQGKEPAHKQINDTIDLLSSSNPS